MIREEVKDRMPFLLSQIKEREFIDGRWHYLNPYEIAEAILNLRSKGGAAMKVATYNKIEGGVKKMRKKIGAKIIDSCVECEWAAGKSWGNCWHPKVGGKLENANIFRIPLWCPLETYKESQ